MRNVLVSWYAYNNDFMIEQRGNQKRELGLVNESGPTFTVHKHFWEAGGYTKHILLYSSDKKNDIEKLNLLVSELNSQFKKHEIIPRKILIDDPINVSEIFSKLQPLLAELTEDKTEIFISPGTPSMQTAWYLLGTHFKKNVTLFQIRDTKFTTDKTKPEKITVTLDNSVLPTNIVIAQKEQDKPKTQQDILITDSLIPVYQKALMISQTDDVGCLILGENGTGKENLANYIHENSNRNKKPFVAVNCAAFSDELLRSELFGHEKGSFTGADSKRIGVFEAANGGTVFLDEVGDISPKMQVSLLRVLQTKKIQPVGSIREIDINVRVIAATNKDIETMADNNEFRTDLFYRLAVTELKLPPLRERGKKEIIKLIEYFNDKFSTRFIDKEKLMINKDALELLTTYGYKGNVRELENLFIQLYTFYNGEITTINLPERIKKSNGITLSLADNEKKHILKVYEICKRRPIITAKTLGIHKDTLYRKLQEYGIDPNNK